ncbi:unnamed protein product [Microthlaspi erraticum]|uniref:F-box domain-containing protein n=1 Tax=Microthlaspi erraticum TaxID=1685480 RepID=A0A6D2JGP2_9BRAS|nr:unnamed protein product [Microthlaspi erraticum]
MMISDLAGDLLEEILCRVPVTYVKLLRSTCKGWNRLFNDSRFRRNFLDKAAKQFLILDLKEFRLCSVSVNLHGHPSTEVIGKVDLDDSQINIHQASTCDGLLLCTIIDDDTRRIVVWNPCTGQTKWIQPRYGKATTGTYTLGSGKNSYKVLRRLCHDLLGFEICDVSSNSWRTIDAPPGCKLDFRSVSLKGKTYWFDTSEEHVFLVSFDYTRETFERLSLDAFQIPLLEKIALSVVREEKLSMLLQRPPTLNCEIWVTDKIDDDETKALSWMKIFTVDYPEAIRSTLLSYSVVDEEKKAVLICYQRLDHQPRYNIELSTRVYVVGENYSQRTDFGGRVYSYVPSFIQFH